MQTQDQEIDQGSNIDHRALIMKGKRTKRQRSSSPFGLTVTSSSSSACGGDGSDGGGGVAEEFNSISSPVTSSEIYESTEEEEDMANCLIMLAQSNGPKRRRTGKKFEMVTSTNKADFSAYECKTCNRSFQSFQALGGHRASHKKLKGAMEDDKKQVVLTVKDHHVEDADQFNIQSPAVLALQVSNNNKGNSHANKGNKIHECSICGSEFSSGQALGGHMRRHRTAAAAPASNQAAVSTVDTTRPSSPIESRNGDGIKRRNVLLLDLNLPAPEEDLRDSKFQFGAPQQAIVFSTPALVDCHY